MTTAVEAALVRVVPVSSRAQRECPFRGLEPYAEGDRHRLFGREQDLLMVRDRIFAAPVTVLMAAAGAGKTSFIDALLAPDLSERFAEHYDVLVHRNWSSSDPWQVLGERVALRRENHGLILILDQFEEIFQHAPSSLAIRNLREGLCGLANESRTRLVISLREEFLAQLIGLDDVLHEVLRNYHRLATPDREQAIDIVVRTAAPTPVSEVGVARLIDGLSFESGVVVLPYLQIACRRLWKEESKSRGLHFEFLAGFSKQAASDDKAHEQVVQLMGAHLLEQVAALTSKERTLAAHAVNFLVTSQGAKLPYEIKSLAKHMGAKEHEVLPALEKLSQARVLNQSQRGDETWFELYHDMYAGALFAWSRRLEQERRDALIHTVVAAVAVVLLSVGSILVGYRVQQERQKSELADATQLAANRAKLEQRRQSLLNRAKEREGLELPGEALLLRLAALVLIDGKPQKLEEQREVARLMRPQRWLRATLRMEGANPRAFFLNGGEYLATVSEVAGAADIKNHSLVQLWSTVDGRPYREALVVSGQISGGDLSHSGRFLALRDGSQTQIWDLGDDKTSRRKLLTDPCGDARFLTNDLIVKCTSPFKLRSYSKLPEDTAESFTYPDADATVRGNVMLLYPGGTAVLDPSTFKVRTRYDLSSGERPLQAEMSSKWVWALTRLANKRIRLVVFDREKGDYRSRTTLGLWSGEASFQQSRSGESILIGQSFPGFGVQELNPDGQSVAELPFAGALLPRAAGGAGWLAVQPSDWRSERRAIWGLERDDNTPLLQATPLAIASSGLDAAGDAWFQSNGQTTLLMSGAVGAADGINAQVLSTTESAVLYRVGGKYHYRDVASWEDQTLELNDSVGSASISADGKHVALPTSGDLAVWDPKSQVRRHVGVSLSASDEVSLAPRGRHLLATGWGRTRLIDLGDGSAEVLQYRGTPGGLKWSPDGAFFLLRQQDALYAAVAPQLPTPVPFAGVNRTAVFSPDSAWLLSGGALGTRLTSLGGGASIDYDDLGPPALAAFSRDSLKFAVMSETREVHIVEVGTKRKVSSMTLRVAPRQLMFTPDGLGLLVASERWLHLFRPDELNREELQLVGSRQLVGTWSGVAHFVVPDDKSERDKEGFELVVVTGAADGYLRREVITFRGAAGYEPILGDAGALLEEWSKKLGLSVSNDDVSAVGVIGAPKPARPDATPGAPTQESSALNGLQPLRRLQPLPRAPRPIPPNR